MKLNLYDFDDTIYHGNSAFHFFIFCWKKGLIKTSHALKIPFKWIQYITKNITYTQLQEFIASGLSNIDNLDELLEEFWEKHKKNLKLFYINKKDRSKDIIISASAEFLLEPIAKELGVKKLIGSDVDRKTGKAARPMCRGEEKVIEFKKQYPKAEINEAYGNSSHDIPYMKLAKQAFMVKGNKLHDFKTYKPNILVRFWRWGWSIYHKNEEIWNYLLVGGVTTLIGVGSFILFSRGLSLHYVVANVMSWTVAVIFAYCAYRWFVFHSKEKNKVKEFVYFIEARILTLLLDTGMMIALVDLVSIDDIIAKLMVSVVIVIANYLISKFVVFKKPRN